ncbi:MAG: exodeoxyribonuclease V subunit gamma [Myxococcota bacterium]
MGGLIVHRSNSTDALAAVLSAVVEAPLRDPWTPETVIVRGRGMERWLAMQLADARGIWAGARFPFPRAFVEEILDLACGRLENNPYAPVPLALFLAELLAASSDEQVRRYVDPGSERRYGLAVRLADVFDRYLVFRPEWTRDGPPIRWQRQLWHDMLDALGPVHFAARLEQTLNLLRQGPLAGTPERLSIFGVTSMPPAYLELFSSLAAHSPVHLLALTPSREYWGDMRRQLGLFGAGGRDAEPRLLAALGQHARGFQEQVDGRPHVAGAEAYADPRGRSLLAVLQSDLVNFRSRGGAEAPQVRMRSSDMSLQVHRCHSRMREVEVVHDVLLDAFKFDRSLSAHNVVLMAPRIDEYAPLIDAVFGTRGQIPYRISDRSFGESDPEQRTLDAWFTVLEGRVTSAEVLDLLNYAPLREHFGFEATDLNVLRHWIVGAGIRWGLDPAHRVTYGQPPDPNGTWRFGLERLWMGLAVDGHRHQVADGVAPFTDVRGSQVELLGRLDRLVEAIHTDRRQLEGKQTVSEWCAIALRITRRFTSPASRLGSAAGERLLSVAEASREESVPFASIRDLLLDPLRRDAGSFGFLSGAVTVCELLPMRSIPFDVIVVMGMNDGEFPRSALRSSLDATVDSPRLGDANPLSDDRNVFLEALLSTRRRFAVTFVGRSIKDNSPVPPSPVIDELRAACEQTAGDVWPLVERDHPLHGHSARYFGADERLFTFAERRVRSVDDPGVEGRPFVSRQADSEPITSVELSDLVRLLLDPSRYWFERVLGARIPNEESAVPQRESTSLDGLERWLLTDQVMNDLALDDTAEIEAGLSARGVLPLGTLGEIEKGAVMSPATALRAEAHAYTEGLTQEWYDESVTFGEIDLTGRLDQVFGRRRLELSPSRVDDRVPLRAWVSHLFGVVTGRIDESLIVRLGKDRTPSVIRFAEVAQPEDRLRDLLRVFALGRRLPLPLFRHASSVYVRQLSRGAEPSVARRRARAAFESRDRDAAVALMYRDGELIERAEPVCGVRDAEFSALAERVLSPAVESER